MRVIGAAPHSGGGCIGWTTLAPALHAATLYKGARVATKVDDDVLTVMPSD